MNNLNEGIYKRGLAVGQTNIREDSMTLRWRDEVYEFVLSDALKVATYNGYWYSAPIKKVRALAKKLKVMKLSNDR